VEFLEQPCWSPRTEGEIAQRRSDDVLRGLAADRPTPIALDESIASEADIERWLGAGWRGVFVVKPSLLGNLPDALQRLQAARADVVFSSALETAIGAPAGSSVRVRVGRGAARAGFWRLAAVCGCAFRRALSGTVHSVGGCHRA
jgi:O-succinylbenzoate synthase